MTTTDFKRRPRLVDVCADRDNHFNLIRMLAASGVLVSHAFPIALGRGAEEPLQRALDGVSLGTVCVYVFFAISGFFIAQSFERTSTFERFVRARVLRLFPALAVVLAATAMVGAALTSAAAGAYWPEAAAYTVRNLTLFFLRWDLPGVFDANPYGTPINGSLWTLSYEVLCYGGVALAGLIGALRSRMVTALIVLAAVLAFIALKGSDAPGRLRLLADLGLPFAFGAGAYVWREKIVLDGRIAAVLAIAALAARLAPGAEAAFHPLFILALSYTVFWLGYMPFRAFLTYNRL
ncbi:MAG: acyltransferase family protein, partial [Pseudomonadota bacterium]